MYDVDTVLYAADAGMRPRAITLPLFQIRLPSRQMLNALRTPRDNTATDFEYRWSKSRSATGLCSHYARKRFRIFGHRPSINNDLKRVLGRRRPFSGPSSRA